MKRREFIKTGIAGSLALSGVLNLHRSELKGAPAVGNNSNQINKNTMKIVVLTGSPRRNGNTAFLADNFIKGAKEAGHNIFRFDAAFQKVEGCTACNSCGMNGPCVLKDDFDTLRPHIIEAGMVVFVTPMYYFGISSQLKKVIDRFYAINGQIKGSPKKAAYMMAYANTSDSEAQPMVSHYQTLVDYLGWKDVGQIIAPGMWPAGAVKNTNFGNKAYQLGKSV
ncbi:MAG: flavodoxin family protein [Prevotellaceae bacterium]|jgi:multimeric flavodoxin WrbA|nr:flavodoxin family protein [Prevotellaceae bacterium]